MIFLKMGVAEKKIMGVRWATRPWLFFGENGLLKKIIIMGSAHFLAVQFLGAHDPYIPSQEPQMPPGLEPKSAPMGGWFKWTYGISY